MNGVPGIRLQVGPMHGHLKRHDLRILAQITRALPRWKSLDNTTNFMVNRVTMAVPFIACMALTATVYHLPPRVLPSIQKVEGGRPGLVHRNTNGTEDLGVMQINQVWIGPIARRVGWPEAAVRERLLNDPCFNIAAAGAIMR